ncbi:GGDEF domain-containing protein [Shewanella sp. OMA3-2]|uniref:GGDEF domain-containing protein n=1 Tax=Shewanella sp. OMA3-2 TaxID=2908650 RepID=UPI001F2E4EB9|nr:sensor domain-containing diguanylate cyclase [Shewanella sp. OMA3-2]UJF21165.1 GGDEF domain-containing protein [Shewanella sp. OMA3-2]
MDLEIIEEYEAITLSLPDLVFVLTESGRYTAILGGNSSDYYHNASFLKGLSLFDVLPEEKANWFIDRIQETLLSNKLNVFEYSLAADDVKDIEGGSGPIGLLRFEGRVNPLKTLRYGERAVVWVARNITERYQLEQKLIYQSQTDFLTNIINRRKFIEYLNDAYLNFKQGQQGYSLLVFDIDNFKNINDIHGHLFGDDILKKVVKICQAELKQTDIFGRLGGDEFGVIHINMSAESCIDLARRLNQQIADMHINDKKLQCGPSISIGISQFLPSDKDVEQIYHRADSALYDSKRNGKNKFSQWQ